MVTPYYFTRWLIATTALVAPATLYAQTAPAPAPPAKASTPDAPATDAPAMDAPDQAPQQGAQGAAPDISIPGGDIVVVGRRNTANVAQTAPQVVSVLSSADIARTGEGNIAGSLGRVTGLSVVNGGFVYVRGLGDRYSLALLNGSPLPSPEPLKRVVPLDLFPTGVIASSLVQKSYSVNFPGEFGGGVINLTTKAVPKEPFLSIGGSLAVDSETTGKLGYVYYGAGSDWSGFDDGSRTIAPTLSSYLSSGQRISEGTVNTQAIAGELVRARQVVVQRNNRVEPNFGINITGGTTMEIGDATLGMVAAIGYSNKWRTRDTIQQTGGNRDLSLKDLDFQRVITDNRIVVNALVGYGLEFGENKLRWTNLYIRDTLKQARIGVGQRLSQSPRATFIEQDTAWFERQLTNTQIAGEFRLTPDIKLDVRGGFANSKRQAPNEFSFEYFRSNVPSDPFGEFFINRLNNGQRGDATVSYSRLNENLWSGSADLSYRLAPELRATIGYAYTDTRRRTEKRDFQFSAPNTLPNGVALFRPDLLLAPNIINAFNIGLVDTNEANPAFRATLVNHAGYAQLQIEATPTISLNAGFRYEDARQTIAPIQVFRSPTASLAGTDLRRRYLLPAMTATWQLADRMQIRINASKTIARPQFRELIFQDYFDPESNRKFRGNPRLADSQLFNGELRYEWYFARDQRVSLAGFYKRIDNPIETFVSFDDNRPVTSFVNAPRATLYGSEIELLKYFPLDGVSRAPFFASRRAVLTANYTYTKSKIRVRPGDPAAVFALSANQASDYLTNGLPLTGQSDHIANLEIGFEDTDTLSQQTLLLSYASDRVTSRGAGGQPDIVERPGLRLDFVARGAVRLFNIDAELKVEARNLTRTRYQEFQQSGDNRIYYNRYRNGTTISVGLTANF
jgi:TonB-dependent receptor